MAKKYREIIKIDEERCNGCGACVPACKEGALQIVDGKARLVSEVYCDGLGACLGICPRDAITIERREAEEFDEKAVEKRKVEAEAEVKVKLPCGCPGMMAKSIKPKPQAESKGDDIQSQLAHWPIQLQLIPANAPYLKGAKLVLLADCTAVAYPNLHRDMVVGNVIAMACPKMDDREANVEKLARVIGEGAPGSIEVVMMEVPCCSGLYAIAKDAIEMSGVNIPIDKKVVSVEGNIIG